MDRPNLFTIAAENEPKFPARFEEICRAASEERAARLQGFSDRVARDGRVSVNMRSWKLRALLDKGMYQNPHEVAQEIAAASNEAAEDVLRRLQGDWYGKRVAFDRYFEDGEQFRYGILNIGGDGPTYYGKFCVVFDPDAPWQTAYLPGNSLELYVAGPEEGHRIDEGSIRESVAPPAQRHRLAALKHADDLDTTPEPSWPLMLCREGVFVEAIFHGQAALDRVEEIRVNRADLRRLGRLLVKRAQGGLSADEETEALEFLEIQRKLLAHGPKPRMKGV